MNLVIGFCHFWYDFVVGDSAMLAIGGLTTLLLGALLVWAGWHAAAEILLPTTVVATLGLSLASRGG